MAVIDDKLAKLAEEFKKPATDHMGIADGMMRGPGSSAYFGTPRRAGKSLFSDLYMGMPAAVTSAVKTEGADEPLTIEKIKTLKEHLAGIDPAAKSSMVVLDSFYDGLIEDAYAPNEKVDLDLMATFSDPKYPDATVTVRKEGLDKHDPRNPNPSAPPGYSYFLYAAGRRSNRGFSHLKLAKVEAQELHQRLVNGLRDADKKAHAHLPNYGRFA